MLDQILCEVWLKKLKRVRNFPENHPKAAKLRKIQLMLKIRGAWIKVTKKW